MAKKAGNTKYVGQEPEWDANQAKSFSESEYREKVIRSLNYYNYNFLIKDIRKHINAWVLAQAKAESKDKIIDIDVDTAKLYAKTPDAFTTMTAGSLIKSALVGMPLTEQHIKYLQNTITSAIARHANSKPVEDTAKKGTVKQLTIQDRMNNIMNDHILHFDIIEDEIIAGKKVDPKAYTYLTEKQVPQALLKKMSVKFKNRADEIAEAKEGKCEQLKEAYAHLKAKDYKRFADFYGQIIEALDQYTQVKKATKKARVKKAPAKAKIVAKLKYLKEATAQKLVSVNPVTILGARKLWVYNIKTRKMGCYIADELSGGLSVKGTTIQDYSSSSVQKTLRKPDQQLKEFNSAGKIKLRKFMKDIKAVEIKLNGRINADTVLLKVE